MLRGVSGRVIVLLFVGAWLGACGAETTTSEGFGGSDVASTTSPDASAPGSEPDEGACSSDEACLAELAEVLEACQVARCGDDGVCTVVVAEDGATCDDGAPCTEDDVCSTGVCSGVPRSCDDGNPCTQDSCDPKVTDDPCVHVVIEGGCDDGDYCTLGDLCVEGECVGEPVDCSALDADCAQGVCDPSNGSCLTALSEDGSACDDGDLCTTGDQCIAGECVSEELTCADMDTACVTYGCEAESGECVVKATYDEVACDDGDPCTDFDQCADGVCVSGETLNCTHLDDPCNLGVCVAGECATQAMPIGTSCDDGNACTEGDLCANGVCLSGDAPACDDGNLCNGIETCDPETGGCINGEPIVCDDANPCNGVESCEEQTGSCVSTEPVICDDADPCNGFESCSSSTGECVPGDPIVCDDGNPCDGVETCEVGTGACLPGVPVTCDDEDACNGLEVCDPSSGGCLSGEAVLCDDGLPCNGFETCDPVDGACLAGEPTLCDDGDACNGLEACDVATGECYSGAAPQCDDGDACNGVESCDSATGSCLAGSPVVCDDEDACNGVESCDTLSGACLEGIAVICDDDEACNGLETCDPADGTCLSGEAPQCDDGLPCNGVEFCDNDAGGCVNGAPVDCQDDNPCDGVTACDEGSGNCVTGPAPSCDDGEPCNGTETCDPQLGGCVDGEVLDCDDGLACTDDACVEGVGCEHTLNPECQCATIADCAPFQTEGLCDGSLDCVQGVCSVDPLTVVPCDTSQDGPCENTGCDLETGQCETLPDTGTPCGDGDLCTVQDACLEGTCVGVPKDCTYLDEPCAEGVCQAIDGACVSEAALEGAPCEDGDPCTVDQACSSGACAGGSTPDCSDFDSECATGACLASFGGCYPLAINEGGVCNDGDLCTLSDLCQLGVCSGEAKDCELDDEECATGGCEPESGECIVVPFDEADECDDGDLCTELDFCDEGVCVGTPLDCQGEAGSCQVSTCDPDQGCVFEQAPDGVPCDAEDGCTTEALCASGSCVGEPVDCADVPLGPCEVVSCDPEWGSCVVSFAPEESPCDDGDACTSNERCFSGACVGEPIACPGDPESCILNACDPSTGACVSSSVGEGESCDDGNLCTEVDLCQGGQCQGQEVDCGGGTSCASASCDPESGGCVLDTYSDGTPCNDESLCTTGDQCTAGQCIGEDVVCESEEVCTLLSCDESTGACSITAPQANGTPCGVGSVCEGEAQCQGGVCEEGTPLDCGEASGPCLVVSCDEVIGGCVEGPAPEGTSCDDGDGCTANDQCASGVCSGVEVEGCGAVPVLCEVSGEAGAYGHCQVHVARRCASVSPTGTLQFYFSWDPSLVQVVYFTDSGQDPSLTPPFADPLYQTYPSYMGSFGAPGFYPTCTAHPTVPGFCLDYTHQYNTGPGSGSDDWPGEMTIFVYTDGPPQPIVEGLLDEGEETLVFNLHYTLLSEVSGASPSPIYMTEVVADDLDTAPLAPVVEQGVVVLDASPSVCP